MFLRPNPFETDEDLLRLQEEYFRKKQQTSTLQSSKVNEDNKSENTNDISDQLANTFETIPECSLGAIRERLQVDENTSKRTSSNAPKTGFPKVQKLSSTSRFGRKFRETQNDKEKEKGKIGLPATSQNVYSDPQDINNMKNEIHAENTKILLNMTSEEIKAEQERYMKSLDPALIAFIKSRKKAQTETAMQENCTDPSPVAQNEEPKLDDIQVPLQIVSEASDNHWIGFDKIEVDKLSWMKDVKVPKEIKDKEFEARFDFQGWLLPYKYQEINETNRILYHHGDEAERPGYTLQELFQLSRSTVTQQRVIALNCIANILRLTSLGIYSDIIEIPIEQIFFVIRFCLDDNTPAVLNSSIKAMHHLIYFYTDEVALDYFLVYGFGDVQPILSVDDKEDDDFTENDQQVIEKNLIKCLVRTNILNRIRYIIESIQPSLEDIHHCIEILIRLARDSKFVFEKIIKCDGLLKVIVENYLPIDKCNYSKVLAAALKLVRVLMCRDKRLAVKFIDKYHIIQSIEEYLSNELFYSNIEGLKIQIECFNLWKVLLHYHVSLDDFIRLQPILLRLLNQYVNTLDIDQQKSFVVFNHLASYLNLLAKAFSVDYSTNQCFISLVMQGFKKWSYQLMTRGNCNFNILSASIFCLCSYAIRYYDSEIDKVILNLFESENFTIIGKHITKDSMLMNKCKINASSVNLKTLETGAWNSPEHVITILQIKNCIPLISALSELALTSGCQLVKENFLKHDVIKIYIDALLKKKNFYNINNWFTRIESTLIMNILKLSKQITNFSDWLDIYSLTIKTLPIFNIIQREDLQFLLTNIVFHRNFLSEISSFTQNLPTEDVLSSTNEMEKVYSDFLNLGRPPLKFETTLSLDVKFGNVMPIDWLYTPIVALYSQNQDNMTISEESQLYYLTHCLRWISFSEKFLPPISQSIEPTEKYCRVACVFLAHDSNFLDPKVHLYLENLLKSLMPYAKDIDFNKDIQGVSNFEDFYKLLVEQYQGVSYGDRLFANVVLLPLAQRHNVKWRKILWSEYLGTVQSIFITQEQLMFDVEELLQPPEKDESVILCYKKALRNGILRKNSLLYKVALHHVQVFMQTNEQR